MTKPTRTRDQVVKECVTAVASCWGHYSDARLIPADCDALLIALGCTLPEVIDIEEWQAYAIEHERRCLEEESEENNNESC